MADIPNGLGHISNYVIVSGITIDEGKHDFPIFLYMERPPTMGQNSEKLHLLACKRAPVSASAMIRPRHFQPRNNIVGWAQYLGRNQLMWQDRENGACQWEVHPFRVLAGAMASVVSIQRPVPTSQCGH